MKLKELLKIIDVDFFDDNIEVKGITCNSKKVKKDYLFIAIKGNTQDGNSYIDEAIKKKACYVISDSISKNKVLKISNINDLKHKLFYHFYDYPQNKLTLLSVTGTNGKSSTAYIIYDLLNKLNAKTMYLGTLGIKDNEYTMDVNNTTPDVEVLAEEFHKAVKRKTKYIIMEVSSHALALNRVNSLEFKGAIYTNLTHDHLDYHKTMENYLLAKKKLFTNLSKDAFAIINYDDKYHSEIEKDCNAKVIRYGFEAKEYKISDVSRGLDGISFDLGVYKNIKSKLLGVINAYNLSAAFLCLKELGLDEEKIIEKIKDIDTINGRLEKVYTSDYTVILDYAHTPDAMEKVLVEIKPLASNRLIVLFGCGGNRDRSKRKVMGEIATKYADVVYVTSDNPRFENPLEIIKDILEGCKNENKIVIEENREKALIKALKDIQGGDILMVLGKGHEEYQIIKDNYTKCSDKKMIQKWLQI